MRKSKHMQSSFPPSQITQATHSNNIVKVTTHRLSLRMKLSCPKRDLRPSSIHSKSSSKCATFNNNYYEYCTQHTSEENYIHYIFLILTEIHQICSRGIFHEFLFTKTPTHKTLQNSQEAHLGHQP